MGFVWRWRPALAAGMWGLGAAMAAHGAVGSDAIQVDFRDPDRFTDIGQDPKVQAEWMADLRRHLQKRAGQALPAGDRLVVTVTDVARAGVVRHLPFRDTRIVRDDAAPPRIDLDFKWLSARGDVVDEGSRRLEDVAYRYRTAVDRGTPAALENRLIDGWVKREFESRPMPKGPGAGG